MIEYQMFLVIIMWKDFFSWPCYICPPGVSNNTSQWNLWSSSLPHFELKHLTYTKCAWPMGAVLLRWHGPWGNSVLKEVGWLAEVITRRKAIGIFMMPSVHYHVRYYCNIKVYHWSTCSVYMLQFNSLTIECHFLIVNQYINVPVNSNKSCDLSRLPVLAMWILFVHDVIY